MLSTIPPERRAVVSQLLRFLVSGAFVTALGVGVYAFVALGLRWHPQVGNLLAYLVRETAARLGEDWDLEIVEMHHRLKADAPSGTALMLGRVGAEGRGVELDSVAVRGRDGLTGPREPGRIGFASLRGGSVAGEHLAIFAAEGERLELGHRAESRAIFARGAIAAALWLVGRPAGRYAMADVLGLK